VPAYAVQDQSQLKFNVDYARFRTSSNFSYLEVYYSVFRDQLKFVPDNNQFCAEFQIQTSIYLSDSLVVQDTLNNMTYTDSLSQVTSTQILNNLTGFVIKEGSYRLEVQISDQNSNLSGSLEMELDIASFLEDELAISDIELASRIMPQKENDRFTKNNYQVIPNPGGIFGTGAPLLYFYSEVYNFSSDGIKNQYRSKYSLVDGNGDELRVFQDKIKNKPGVSSVEVSGFNIISLHSGTYFLKVEIEDFDSGEKISMLKKFHVYRPDDFQKRITENKSNIDLSKYLNSPQYQSYDLLDEKALDLEFDGSSYIATKNEKNVYKNLDLNGKRNFMKSFWLNRDADRLTIHNEFREPYLNRLQYVNENFGSGKPGWKADRGRVLLLYGVPDEIERFPSSSENRAYEIWNYYKIQGGIVFIFVDIRGFGDYILVHSTARDELQDMDWQRWIYPQ